MKFVDQRASDALNFILANKIDEMSLELKTGWVRFLMSLLQRSPGRMIELARKWEAEVEKTDATFQARYEKGRTPTDPETFQEYMRQHPERMARGRLRTIQKVMDLPRVGEGILNMRWTVIPVGETRYELLTSDRPIIMTNGIGKKGGHIGLAIDPKRLFIAAQEIATINQIAAMTPRELVRTSNEIVVRQAERQVYGRSDRELEFVERRLRQIPPAPKLITGTLQHYRMENQADKAGKPEAA